MGCRKNANLGLLFLTVIIMTNVSTLLADSITLRNGDTFTGQVLNFEKRYVIYQTAIHPQASQIPWEQVKSLKTDSQLLIDLGDGESLVGTLVYTAKSGFKIKSRKAGVVAVGFSGVAAIKRAGSAQPEKRSAAVTVASKTEAGSAKSASAEAIGDEPGGAPKPQETLFGEEAESAPLTFLRGSSVLLNPGQVEGRLNFGYVPQKASNYGTRQNRLFYASLGVNAGLHERVEGWVSIPFGYKRVREDSIFFTDRASDIGLMDISFGLNALLFPETNNWPEMTLALNATAPTGKDPYTVDELVTFGNGHWKTGLGLNFVRSVDPAILFWGVSADYLWPHHEFGRKFEYGWTWGYNFGMGFAVNERLSFSSRLHGQYMPGMKADGSRQGFSTDPMYASFSFGYRSGGFVLEPQVSFGINEDSENAQLVLGISKKFN